MNVCAIRPISCPVCGKKPKVIFDLSPGGSFVKIRCKPWFHETHFEVECGGADPEWAYEKAVTKWNIDAWLFNPK